MKLTIGAIVLGLLYLIYNEVKDYFLINRVNSDTLKNTQIQQMIAIDDQLVKTAADAADKAVKDYENAKSSPNSTSNTSDSSGKSS